MLSNGDMQIMLSLEKYDYVLITGLANRKTRSIFKG